MITPDPEAVDIEVLTALLADYDGSEPTLPIIVVKLARTIYGLDANGRMEDVFGRYSHNLGFRVLHSPREVCDVDLDGWQVVCDATTGVVTDSEGELWANSVAPFPMWRSHAEHIGNRVGVLYTPGLHVPDPDPGDIATLADSTELERLCRQGRVLGGMAPLVDSTAMPPTHRL